MLTYASVLMVLCCIMTIGLCLFSPQFVFVGFMIGAVLFGIVADVYGRKRVSDNAHHKWRTG